jgi:hypothetical protein
MPNTKPVGVAYSDPELVSGTTITSATITTPTIATPTITTPAITGGTVTGATIDATAKVLSNVATGVTVSGMGATIATTGNGDVYFIAPQAGTLTAARFSGVDALAANDSNYITFSITNLGLVGSGSAAMLAASAANTTKSTGGTATVANARRALTLSATPADLVVAAGDRLLCRAAATGTLANTVTFPVWQLTFSAL